MVDKSEQKEHSLLDTSARIFLNISIFTLMVWASANGISGVSINIFESGMIAATILSGAGVSDKSFVDYFSMSVNRGSLLFVGGGLVTIFGIGDIMYEHFF